MSRRALIVALLSIELLGCSSAPTPQPATPTVRTKVVREDACGARMQDLSEALLLFYLRNQRLPDDLDELKKSSDPTLIWECPVTHLPYVYDRVGFYNMQTRARVVLFDATPAHLGMRWAVQIIEPADHKKALIAEVVLEPESMFIMRAGK